MRRLEIARLRKVTRVYLTCAFAGATAAPAPRESAGRFTPVFEKGRLKRASQDFSRDAEILLAARTVKSQVERSEYNNQPSTASEANLELTTATTSLWHISISRQRAQH